jgi:hypothetical protein
MDPSTEKDNKASRRKVGKRKSCTKPQGIGKFLKLEIS